MAWIANTEMIHPLALYVKLAERPSHEVSRDLRPRVLRDRHSSGFAFCNHPRGDVDGVTLDVELVPLLPHDAGNDWASVNAEPDRPAQIGLSQARCHLETASNGAPDRVVDFVQQPGRGHERVADGLAEPVNRFETPVVGNF
jgi:hypothetical protein